MGLMDKVSPRYQADLFELYTKTVEAYGAKSCLRTMPSSIGALPGKISSRITPKATSSWALAAKLGTFKAS